MINTSIGENNTKVLQTMF